MTPTQQAALEGIAGRALTQQEIEQIDPLLDPDNRDDVAITAKLQALRPPAYVETRITELGVRRLAVLPRHRFALLEAFREAEAGPPAWASAALEAAQVPAEDRPALLDDLASGWRWLQTPPGIDIAAPGARQLLDVIAVGVPQAAPACEAVKLLAPVVPLDMTAVSFALNVADGRTNL